jgi:hypothetical protein
MTSTMSRTISVIEQSFGVNTRATPPAISARASAAGTMPPTTTGTSPRPAVLRDRHRDDLRRRQPYPW